MAKFKINTVRDDETLRTFTFRIRDLYEKYTFEAKAKAKDVLEAKKKIKEKLIGWGNMHILHVSDDQGKQYFGRDLISFKDNDTTVKDWSGSYNGAYYDYSNGVWTITHKNGKVEKFPDEKFNATSEIKAYIDNFKDAGIAYIITTNKQDKFFDGKQLNAELKQAKKFDTKEKGIQAAEEAFGSNWNNNLDVITVNSDLSAYASIVKDSLVNTKISWDEKAIFGRILSENDPLTNKTAIEVDGGRVVHISTKILENAINSGKAKIRDATFTEELNYKGIKITHRRGLGWENYVVHTDTGNWSYQSLEAAKNDIDTRNKTLFKDAQLTEQQIKEFAKQKGLSYVDAKRMLEESDDEPNYGESAMWKAMHDAGIEMTQEPGTDKIIYVMQSDIDKNLYIYIGKKYAMKDGEWTYAKYKLNGVTPEKLKQDLKIVGWHEVPSGPAKIIDSIMDSWADDAMKELNKKGKANWNEDDWETYHYIEQARHESGYYEDSAIKDSNDLPEDEDSEFLYRDAYGKEIIVTNWDGRNTFMVTYEGREQQMSRKDVEFLLDKKGARFSRVLRDSVKDSVTNLNASQIDIIKKYAARYEENVEDIINAIHQLMWKKGISAGRAMERVLENIVAGSKLTDSGLFVKGKKYKNQSGIVVEIVEEPDNLGQITYKINNVPKTSTKESFENMLSSNGYKIVDAEDKYFRVTYETKSGMYSAVLVKADNEEQAKTKFMQRKPGFEVVGAMKIHPNEVEGLTRRGMSVFDEETPIDYEGKEADDIIRRGTVEEYNAIQAYEPMIMRLKELYNETQNEKYLKAAQDLEEINNEEKKHIGEFAKISAELDPKQSELVQEGMNEVDTNTITDANIPDVKHTAEYLWTWNEKSQAVADRIFEEQSDKYRTPEERLANLSPIFNASMKQLNDYEKALKAEIDKMFNDGSAMNRQRIKELYDRLAAKRK